MGFKNTLGNRPLLSPEDFYWTKCVTDCVTDYVTDCVTDYVTDCVTDCVTDYVTDCVTDWVSKVNLKLTPDAH